MMRIICIIMVCSLLACEHVEPKLDPNYQSYTSTIADRRPLLSMEFDVEGRIRQLMVDPAPDVQPYQRSYHPAWQIFGNAATIIGEVMASGWAVNQMTNNYTDFATTQGQSGTTTDAITHTTTNTTTTDSFNRFQPNIRVNP